MSLDHALGISSLCKSIMQEQGIACVSIVNKRGRVIESDFKEAALIQQMSNSELEMLYMQRTLQTTMIRELDHKHGRWIYTITERGYGIELIMPFNDGIVFVMAESNAHIQDLVRAISKIVVGYSSNKTAAVQ